MKTLKINFPDGQVGHELLYHMGADWRDEKTQEQGMLIEKCEGKNPIKISLREAELLKKEVSNALDIKADHLDNESWGILQQYHLSKFGDKIYNFIKLH